MVKSIIWSVFLLLSFIACKPINIEKPNVTSVSIVGDQLIVRGSNFLNIEGLALSTTGYNKPFQVTSVSQSQIVGVAVDSQKVTVPSLLNLIIDSAQGQSTYPVSFSLQANSVTTGTIQNGAVTRLKLNKEPTDNPADGDVLSWDSGSGQFVFAPYNAGGGGGGSVTSVTRGIGIANQGTSITTNGTISVNTGITGSSTSTVIPFFNSANQIEIASTAEIFLPGPGANYYILNNAGKFAIQNSASLDAISVDNSGNVNIPISLKVANQSVCLADGTNCLTDSGDVTGPSTSNVNRVSVFSDGTGKVIKETLFSVPTTAPPIGSILKATAANTLSWTADSLGDVVGMSSSTDGHLTSYLGTSGTQIQDSGLLAVNIPIMVSPAPSSNTIILSAGNSKSLSSTSYTIPASSCANGQILKTDSSGNFICADDTSGVTLFNGRAGAVTPTDGDYTASQITNLPGFGLTAINVQSAIDEIQNNKLPLAGGTMTGTITTSSTNAILIGPSGGATGEIHYLELPGNGTNTVGFKAPTSIVSDIIWTLPASDGASGAVLTTNGNKVLGWTSIGSGGVGDVVGPSSSTDGHLASFQGATGKQIQDSGLLTSNIATMVTIPSGDQIVLSVNGSKQLVTTNYSVPPAIGTATYVLKSNGANVTWQQDEVGTGDVVGPGSSASGTLPIFSDGTGKKLGDSTIIANDVVTMTSVGTGDYVLKSTLASKTATESNLLVSQIATMALNATSTNMMILSGGSDKSLKTTGYTVPPTIGTANYVLKSNGINVDWAPDVGGGDVTGPASSRANVPALFSGTSGKIIADGEADFIDFKETGSAPSYKEGRLFYDSTNKALAYYINTSGITLDMGQQMVFLANNNSGVTIPIGSAVYVTGSTGGGPNARPTIAMAQANSVATSRIIGITSQAMPNNSDGYVTNFGLVKGLNTSGFASGAILYLSDTNAGQFTTTPPAYPVPAGRVLYSNNPNGVIGLAPVIGAGNVFGPATSVDGRPAIFSGTSGKQLANTVPYTIPTDNGTGGQVLTTNGAGTTSWTTVAGTGDVLGPTTNASGTVALWDGDNSKKLKQTNYTFPTTDGAFGQILRTNGAGTVGWVDPPSRAALEYPYQFDSSTNNSDPGNGDVKINNTDPSLATFIYISEQDKNNPSVNRSSRFLLLKAGDLVDISSSSNGNDDYFYTVSATPTDAGSYIEIPVVVKSISGTITNNQSVVVALVFKSPTQLASLGLEPSDLRIKTAIKPIDSSLENILKLNTIRYKWKYENDQRYQVGLDAEEVKDLFPDLIGTVSPPLKSNIDEQVLGINYSKMVVPLIKAFQEKAKADEKTIQMLVQRIEHLEKIIEEKKK